VGAGIGAEAPASESARLRKRAVLGNMLLSTIIGLRGVFKTLDSSAIRRLGTYMACIRSDRAQVLCGSGGLIGNEPAGFGVVTRELAAGITGACQSCTCADGCS
jgi:hypothetical protein